MPAVEQKVDLHNREYFMSSVRTFQTICISTLISYCCQILSLLSQI